MLNKCEFKGCNDAALKQQDFCGSHIQEPCFWNKEVVNRPVAATLDESEILGKQLDAIMLALFIGAL